MSLTLNGRRQRIFGDDRVIKEGDIVKRTGAIVETSNGGTSRISREA